MEFILRLQWLQNVWEAALCHTSLLLALSCLFWLAECQVFLISPPCCSVISSLWAFSLQSPVLMSKRLESSRARPLSYVLKTGDQSVLSNLISYTFIFIDFTVHEWSIVRCWCCFCMSCSLLIQLLIPLGEANRKPVCS